MQWSSERGFRAGQRPTGPRPASWPVWHLLLAALLAGPGLALGQEAGEIVSALGQVEVWRDQAWHGVGPGAAISAGERLRTGAGSRAVD